MFMFVFMVTSQKPFSKNHLFWFDSSNSHYISVSSYHSRGIGR
nr:MAG TPA: hypothetical protein [Caudoviricetes sp.]